MKHYITQFIVDNIIGEPQIKSIPDDEDIKNRMDHVEDIIATTIGQGCNISYTYVQIEPMFIPGISKKLTEVYDDCTAI